MGADTAERDEPMAWNNTDETEADELDLGFDLEATEAAEPMSFDILPKGEYPVLITGCTPKAGQKEGSRYVAMEVTIIAGKGKSRKVWSNFTTHHPTSAQAVQIGRGGIKAAFSAAGVTGSSPADLIAAQQPIMAVIGIEKGKKDSDYPDDKNVIKGFKAMKPEQMASLESGEEVAPAEAPKPASKKPSFLTKK